MSTLFSDVLTQYAMQFIDDVRWSEQLATNPAQFFRAKSQALVLAVPRFNRPPTMQSYLTYTLPVYDDYTYTIQETDTFPLTLETTFNGHQLCSVGTVETDATGGVTYTPYTDFTYDDVSGNVVLNTEIPAGTEVDVDLYTDGFFDNDLDPTQQRILGLCVAYDWYFRMANAYLNVINPITDKTFSPRSATSEDKRANTARFTELGRQISSELMAYEQRLYALKYIPNKEWNNLVSVANANPSKTAPQIMVQGNTVYLKSGTIDVKNGTIINKQF